MTVEQKLAVMMGVGYLVGSVPFGLVVGLAKGVDPRKGGSGNIGATNVGRLLGGKYFAIVFLLDLLKALIPMVVAGYFVRRSGEVTAGSGMARVYLLWLGVGMAVILGHMFSIFLGFKGGKGVAASAGVALGVWPDYTVAAGVAIGVFLVVLFAFRYMSVASMAGAVAFPIAYVVWGMMRGRRVFGEEWPLTVFAMMVAGMIVWRHRGNIGRLRRGEEPKIRSEGTKSRRHEGTKGEEETKEGSGFGVQGSGEKRAG